MYGHTWTSFPTPFHQIKEKLFYVSYDLELDHKLAEETAVLAESYTLSDGREIREVSALRPDPKSLNIPA